MNWDRIEGNWKQFQGAVQRRWGKLTNDELDVIAGNQERLIGKLQEKYGISKDEAKRQFSDWEKQDFGGPEQSWQQGGGQQSERQTRQQEMDEDQDNPHQQQQARQGNSQGGQQGG